MKKKIISFAILFIIAATAIISGIVLFNRKEENKIKIWAWDTAVTAANAAVEKYTTINNDIKFEVVDMAQDNVVQKLNVGLASGALNSLPDIVFVEDYNLFGYIKYFEEFFVDLTSEIDSELFMPFKLNSMMQDNKLYGVPYDSGVSTMFYRYDYLTEAGYTEQDLESITWSDYIEIGQQVKATTGKDMLPIILESNMEGRIMLQSGGEWYVENDGTTLNILENESLYSTIETIKALYDADIVYDSATWDDMVSAIYNGDVATVIGACWWGPIIKEHTSLSGKWKVAKLPKMEGNSAFTHYSNLGGSSWVVLNKENKNTCIDFLKQTFASDNELINDLVESIGLVTTLKNAKNVENYNIEDDFWGGQLVYKQLVDWSEYIPSVNYGTLTYEIDSIVGIKIKEVIKNGKSIDQAIQEIYQLASLL